MEIRAESVRERGMKDIIVPYLRVPYLQTPGVSNPGQPPQPLGSPSKESACGAFKLTLVVRGLFLMQQIVELSGTYLRY